MVAYGEPHLFLFTNLKMFVLVGIHSLKNFLIVEVWGLFNSTCVKFLVVMSPPDRVGRHIVFPRASVRPSVSLSVCLSVRHKSCPLYNLKTVKDFSMKLGTLVNHDETMCHAQEP